MATFSSGFPLCRTGSSLTGKKTNPSTVCQLKLMMGPAFDCSLGQSAHTSPMMAQVGNFAITLRPGSSKTGSSPTALRPTVITLTKNQNSKKNISPTASPWDQTTCSVGFAKKTSRSMTHSDRRSQASNGFSYFPNERKRLIEWLVFRLSFLCMADSNSPLLSDDHYQHRLSNWLEAAILRSVHFRWCLRQLSACRCVRFSLQVHHAVGCVEYREACKRDRKRHFCRLHLSH
jgi:hypothetical protein